MSTLRQKPITSEIENLIRAMVEAHTFLNSESPVSNRTRIKEASETLALALGSYQDAIDKMLDADTAAALEMGRRQR